MEEIGGELPKRPSPMRDVVPLKKKKTPKFQNAHSTITFYIGPLFIRH
jgi:hypothetical protein